MARVLWAGGVGRAGEGTGAGAGRGMGTGWDNHTAVCGEQVQPHSWAGMLHAASTHSRGQGRWALLPPELFILGETEEYFVSLTKQHFTSG